MLKTNKSTSVAFSVLALVVEAVIAVENCQYSYACLREVHDIYLFICGVSVCCCMQSCDKDRLRDGRVEIRQQDQQRRTQKGHLSVSV